MVNYEWIVTGTMIVVAEDEESAIEEADKRARKGEMDISVCKDDEVQGE